MGNRKPTITQLTTTGSNRAFYYFNIDSGSANQQLDEASAKAPSTGTGQFVSHGLDPEDTNNLLVSINRSFMLNDTVAVA